MEINTGKMFANVEETLNIPEVLDKEPKVSEYDEGELAETLAKDFSGHIIGRGENYYYDDHVMHVYKNKNKYYATVMGNTYYNVEITVFNEETAQYKCTCPCEFPCKHEYAVIMAIANQEYTDKKLKSFVKKKELDFRELIKLIPAEDLKKYILSLNGTGSFIIREGEIGDYFKKYLPKQKYDYYYNNLYNLLILDRTEVIEKVDDYIESARKYLSNNEFEESFKIVKSIIEAYNDTEKLNISDDVFDIISRISIILRIAFRKTNSKSKKDIKDWAMKLKKAKYYDNYYLEDLILSLDNIK